MNRLLMALAILMMTVVSTLGLAGQASAAPTSGDPLSTGCANGAQTIWQQQVLGGGTIQVRYSPACGTNWVRISGATNRQSEAGIYSARTGWRYSPSYGRSPSTYWTPMVWAPGSECVFFYAKIQPVNGALYDTGQKKLC
ncbi:DUF2690 domain-containing protein [Millisia brevis]|uniref:DUF2690 domain-containing protein n=1 Tax=Millisia brevis TaxID=264148 RepID=UPI0012EDA0BB|nr:DUF2690 domain-containing protein [Millisia brevis]